MSHLAILCIEKDMINHKYIDVDIVISDFLEILIRIVLYENLNIK
jgi:hypothetical protein